MKTEVLKIFGASVAKFVRNNPDFGNLKGQLVLPRYFIAEPEFAAFKKCLEACSDFDIFDDRLHILGSSGRVIDLSHVANWMIARALETDPKTAIDDVYRYRHRKEVKAFQIMLLDGLYFEMSDESVDMGDGVKIVSLMESPVRYFREQAWTTSWGANSKPSSIMYRPISLEREFVSQRDDEKKRPNFKFIPTDDLDDRRLLLSLVTRQGFQSIATTIISADSVPPSGGISFAPKSRRSPVTMGPPMIGIHADQARFLYEKFTRLSLEQRDRLRVPLKKLNEYRAESDFVQSAIDLRTALEALFLEQKTNRGEYRYKVGLRAGLYVGDTHSDGKNIVASVRKAYDLGSTAIHSGRVSHSREATQNLETAAVVARAAIIKMIHQPRVDWSEVELSVGLPPDI